MTTATTELTAREREILIYQATAPKHQGVLAGEVLSKFGMSSVRYFQILTRLVENPAAESYDPELIGSLRAFLNTKRRGRSLTSVSEMR